MEKDNSIIIYEDKKTGIRLETHLKNETVWLTQDQIALAFGTKRPAITKHLNNIFKSRELEEKSVSSILEHTATDNKKYKVTGEKKINNNALTALTLLVAESNPKDKDILVKMIKNLLV